MQVIKLDHDFGTTFGGMLTDEQGGVRALWASYSEQQGSSEREWCAGLPAAVMVPWVERIKHLPPPTAADPTAVPPQVIITCISRYVHTWPSTYACTCRVYVCGEQL